MQVVLVLGGLEWLRALAGYVALRQAAGQPWIRLAAILGAVAALTLVSALAFRARSLRERYGLKGRRTVSLGE